MNPTTMKLSNAIPLSHVRLAGGPMACTKCGVGYMVDDSCGEIEVYRCWACGDRAYTGYPKRCSAHVCSRCGNDRHVENELGYCEDCLKLLNIHVDRVKERTAVKVKIRHRLPETDPNMGIVDYPRHLSELCREK